MEEEIPDYRQRLAYGTDQGRWLMQQQAAKAARSDAAVPEQSAARRRAPAARAYHSIESDDGGRSTPSRPATPDQHSSTAPPTALVIALGVGSFFVLGVLVLLLRSSASGPDSEPWMHVDAVA
ncbi:hypothetical protein EMIHUDRAFT_224285 [Emiliania huxleyi CCMP1516]|uniref:Uncharacterized protein n=2 Tax=Emiliania huxleyi TaxID=2903 RepID=A0A0D3KS05_EMIH1|nr:hypothetical protein EMIHUDRAFT_224285 [Emiliania huxleyi CCMP1516]EOD38540.1 hypothetical protein EMIHUDRAFT_224285 [Emiliania huxleyi CCMP1516]|eukprot:XP_005790969.1 hypothetical protein EMIHUDRAFT_224285 [Emiliania huxleyi CCMP1516]